MNFDLFYFVCPVDILLNATGNVPIMKKRNWTVDQEKQLSWVIRFIHKYLKLDPEEKLVHWIMGQLLKLMHQFVCFNPFLTISSLNFQFLYVNQTFAPSPDQTIKNLYECYATNGKLILYYCKSQAWG